MEEAGGSEVQYHPQLCSEFEASLEYLGPCFKSQQIIPDNILILKVYVRACVCARTGTDAMVCIKRSENSFGESGLAFHLVKAGPLLFLRSVLRASWSWLLSDSVSAYLVVGTQGPWGAGGGQRIQLLT